MRYGMLLDLDTCSGCSACAMACKVENGTLHGSYWCKVLVKEEGKYPNTKKKVLPVSCMHCQDAPCVDACPTGASFYHENGSVQIDNTKCIGCRSCITACPYGARTYNVKDPVTNPYFADAEMTLFEKAKAAKHPVGKVGKCNLCKDRVAEGKEPACVMTCLNKCRFFGDLDDPSSEISQKIIELKAKPLFEHLGTKPSFYYAGTF
jgi:molybdopterin-containing oxidoreductase family iron-sulfur binding subunit